MNKIQWWALRVSVKRSVTVKMTAQEWSISLEEAWHLLCELEERTFLKANGLGSWILG